MNDFLDVILGYDEVTYSVPDEKGEAAKGEPAKGAQHPKAVQFKHTKSKAEKAERPKVFFSSDSYFLS